MQSLDLGTSADDVLNDFINNMLLMLEYKTFSPNEVMVRFDELADRLLYVASGKALLEVDRPLLTLEPLLIKEDYFIGDMAILGDDHWGHSAQPCWSTLSREQAEIFARRLGYHVIRSMSWYVNNCGQT